MVKISSGEFTSIRGHIRFIACGVFHERRVYSFASVSKALL